MRIKILLLGDDPALLMTDGQLLKDRGLMVFTAFNMDNIGELIAEIKPDVVFFDPQKQKNDITAAYNNLVGSINFINIPVVFALAEDEVYLVTRKRTTVKEKRTIIADNMTGAIKMALINNRASSKKAALTQHRTIPFPTVNVRA